VGITPDWLLRKLYHGGMTKYPGRLSRKNFALGSLYLIIVTLLLGIVDSLSPNNILFDLLFILAYLAGFAFLLWLYVFRLHDLDKSGWFSLLIFIPIVDFIFFIYLLFKKGSEESNKYGAPNVGESLWNTFFKKDTPTTVISA
jgi:uncharacterized membrane protein YhaH (DUF805 family)